MYVHELDGCDGPKPLLISSFRDPGVNSIACPQFSLSTCGFALRQNSEAGALATYLQGHERIFIPNAQLATCTWFVDLHFCLPLKHYRFSLDGSGALARIDQCSKMLFFGGLSGLSCYTLDFLWSARFGKETLGFWTFPCSWWQSSPSGITWATLVQAIPATTGVSDINGTSVSPVCSLLKAFQFSGDSSPCICFKKPSWKLN